MGGGVTSNRRPLKVGGHQQCRGSHLLWNGENPDPKKPWIDSIPQRKYQTTMVSKWFQQISSIQNSQLQARLGSRLPSGQTPAKNGRLRIATSPKVHRSSTRSSTHTAFDTGNTCRVLGLSPASVTTPQSPRRPRGLGACDTVVGSVQLRLPR